MNKNDENYIYYLVGQNIKKYRKLRKMSIEKLAMECHYSEGFIKNIESPNYKQTFSLGTLWTISRALNIDIKLLFDSISNENP